MAICRAGIFYSTGSMDLNDLYRRETRADSH